MSKDKKPLICNWTKDKDDLSKYDLGFISGFKHKEDQICSSEVLRKIRSSKSDAEARRIIKNIGL